MTSTRLETIYVAIYEDEHGIERVIDEHDDAEKAVAHALSLRNKKEATDDGKFYWNGEFKVSEYERVKENVIGDVMSDLTGDEDDTSAETERDVKCC